jgi:hypothetical protein
MHRLRAGAALFNAGHYLAAHEPWEERWLQDPRDAREDCIQGLVQATAAIHKARTGNWSGAVGLARSGAAYLEDCDRPDLRAWLRRLAADPELAERERPPPLSVGGEVVTVESLTFPAAGHAAEALAETRGDDLVEQAVEYAMADVEAGEETSPLVSLTLSYLREESPVVRDRIADHVRRRESRDADVEGLFDEE